MNDIKKILKYIYIATISFCVALVVFTGISVYTKKINYTFELQPVADNQYIRYCKAVSAIPAQNYDIVEICCDGEVHTFTGKVDINYTAETPYADVIERPNQNKNDQVSVYVPYGSVIYQESVTVN